MFNIIKGLKLSWFVVVVFYRYQLQSNKKKYEKICSPFFVWKINIYIYDKKCILIQINKGFLNSRLVYFRLVYSQCFVVVFTGNNFSPTSKGFPNSSASEELLYPKQNGTEFENPGHTFEGHPSKTMTMAYGDSRESIIGIKVC